MTWSHFVKILENFLFELEIFIHSFDNKVRVSSSFNLDTKSDSAKHVIFLGKVQSTFFDFFVEPGINKLFRFR